jgi:hypothetical protein
MHDWGFQNQMGLFTLMFQTEDPAAQTNLGWQRAGFRGPKGFVTKSQIAIYCPTSHAAIYGYEMDSVPNGLGVNPEQFIVYLNRVQHWFGWAPVFYYLMEISS